MVWLFAPFCLGGKSQTPQGRKLPPAPTEGRQSFKAAHLPTVEAGSAFSRDALHGESWFSSQKGRIRPAWKSFYVVGAAFTIVVPFLVYLVVLYDFDPLHVNLSALWLLELHPDRVRS